MSDTPLTDAALDGWVQEYIGPSNKSFIEFTRQLERELIAMEAERNYLRSRLKDLGGLLS